MPLQDPPRQNPNLAGSVWQEWFRVIRNRLSIIAGTTSATVGAAGGAAALPATPKGYLDVEIGGVTYKIPYYNY